MQGKTINGYTLQRLLGTGGMAEVWYAENKIGKKAAVKLLLPKFCQDETIVARFENEAKVMVQLDHPNIRQVYDYGNIDGRPCIVMEYLEGEDLKVMMKQGRRFANEELEKWWNQMVEALNYTHNLGIIHRDIKPSNIFIDKRGNVRLLDFGIAKNNEDGVGTLTGSTLGTRIYMSPEQVKDPKRVDYRTDLYSLAVTFVHLLTGKAPYDSTTSSDFEIQLSIVTKPLDLSGLPQQWRDFLKGYLMKESDQRPKLYRFLWDVEDPWFDAACHISDDLDFKDEETVVENTSYHSSIKETDNQNDLIFTVNGVSFVMKKVEGGTFWMGATSEQYGEAYIDEKPFHSVTLSDYYMCETEVTQALWVAIMGSNPSYFKGDNLPVESVSWNDCQEFIRKLKQLAGKNFRLPTEAEWEYAARGGVKSNGYKYAGAYNEDKTSVVQLWIDKGIITAEEAREHPRKDEFINGLKEVAWFLENSGGKTHQVKAKSPNELGLYDMCGNLWEWCSDSYEKYSSDDSQFKPQSSSNNPYRVLRGGSWRNYARSCRVSSRFSYNPQNKNYYNGFRLALSQ